MPRKTTEEAPKKRGRKYTPKFTEPNVTAAPSEPEVAAEPLKKAKGKRVRAELQKLSTDGDLVDIWERRMLNPNRAESVSIRITTPGMKIRWINLAQRGRYQRARYEQGWMPVHKTELADEREIYGVSFTSEGYVCRGEKQGEMLMKIPMAVYRKIQQRRGELNMASYKKLRQNLGSAGYQHFKEKYGGSAGDRAEEVAGKFQGEIKFGTEQSSTTELYE